MINRIPASAQDLVNLFQCSLSSGSELINGENISSNLAKSEFTFASNDSSFESISDLTFESLFTCIEVEATLLSKLLSIDRCFDAVFDCVSKSFRAPFGQIKHNFSLNAIIN